MMKSSFWGYAISLVVHGLVLGALAAIQIQLLTEQPDVLIETFFPEEREQEEFSQELEEADQVATTMNLITGGTVVSNVVGSSDAPPISQTKIETSESLKEPDIVVNAGEITLPGTDVLGEDLGEGEVTGEIGAVVSGYGAAMGRITRELIRLMREQKVLVVWLFDESESMKDDQKKIRAEFHKVYEELGIAAKSDVFAEKTGRRSSKSVKEEILLTSINSFGEKVHAITPDPTGDIKEIQAAILKIPIDESGMENMCQSVSYVIDKYSLTANRGKRKLAIVIVTDESPSDTDALEEAVMRTKRARTPVYILGREAIFGYPKARMRWIDPIYQLEHWVWIDRGPETAFPECLQYDGFGRRHDTFSSGFGPYAQVRLSRESGGIFFMLPGNEENLVGAGAQEERRFAALAMKEYRPLLLSRADYLKERQQSKFRTTLWNIIATLNPWQDDQLNLWMHHFPLDHDKFKEGAEPQFTKAVRAMGMLNEAVKTLEAIRPLRDQESSQRWRACYDLMLAQCRSYRVRLFQYMLALDQHVSNKPKAQKEKSNEWNVHSTGKMLQPDDAQFKRLQQAYGIKTDREALLKELDKQLQLAQQQFLLVEQTHPGTPWSRRAQYERNGGKGITVSEGFRDPRYEEVGKKIKIPKF